MNKQLWTLLHQLEQKQNSKNKSKKKSEDKKGM